MDRPLIFISHSASDAELANALQVVLDDAFSGTLRFFNTSDREQLELGDHWFGQIASALRDATVVLSILTTAGLKSPWVNFESGGAAASGERRLIPCAAGETSTRVLPAPYSHFQAIDLADARDLERLLRRIESLVSLRLGDVDCEPMVERLSRATKEDTPATSMFVDPAELGHRLDHRHDVLWTYYRADDRTDRLGATTRRRMHFTALLDGLDSINLSWTPAIEAVKFDATNPPSAVLLDAKRSGYGSVKLARPHASSGSRFAFKIVFEPPLSRDEEVDLSIDIEFPRYKLLHRDELASFLLQNGEDLRDWDFSSITIENPTELYTYAARFPKDLGILPHPPQARRFRVSYAEEEQLLRTDGEVFAITDETEDGVDYWRAQITRRNPPYRTTYRLCWKLPFDYPGPS